MKKIYITILCPLMLIVGLTSCDDYLDDIPKGSKIPRTLADFEALIRDEYTNHRVNVNQALNLLNDRYVTEATLSFYPLDKANYLWDESADRIALNRADEGTYYSGYAAISTFNLIIENALETTEATEAGQQELWAQAKVLRAMCYFNLANYYADTYQATTASEKLSVPVITSADINAPSEQVSIQELYDFILKDMEDALPGLPEGSSTALHPNLGTGYAFLARVYLQMGNYEQALNYADKALEENNSLYDWRAYYNDNKSVIEDPDAYISTPSPMGFDYVENYNYRHGALSRITTENNIPVERAPRFEEGDARFLSRWKIRTVGAETFYNSTLSGYFNYGGMTTVEVYLIKAECLARQGSIDDAMAVLNRVRKTRILPDVYQDLTAANEAEAMEAILRTKKNELILTIVPFCDARRLNTEGVYTTGFTKEYKGETYTLTPDSHLWTMPFPQGATDNPGNGTITQNVDK
ncbi:RagB/SusD family nutrient uptake outer membrane protein [Sinomicrobium kalidii]|uniref:RagB/SusD family nutrient uptake outer membrane protein n=1 Tax=Sinomicrobium kalidii TaxID=2900738 RepID=UPI001E625098|nr:RagB/SusD family nutrient uptake outer membrane protein [Sinomicrobium kalidii]UGU14737.1 RagB/SusD family nutrient uptake outer membrane protein [Sinomicrobium kalidii]